MVGQRERHRRDSAGVDVGVFWRCDCEHRGGRVDSVWLMGGEDVDCCLVEGVVG